MSRFGKGAAFANRFAGAPNYAPTASLTTPTYDSSGETTEPTWRAKPSWVTASCTDLLAHNPLTGGSDEVENPSLLISNDHGATWTTPAGLTNPIAAKPTAAGQPGHNYDCFILDDPTTQRLIMFWCVQSDPAVVNGGNQNGVWYSTCTDTTLATWSARAQLFSLNGIGGFTIGLLEQEPKILWDVTRGKFVMFTQDATDPNTLKMRVGGSSSPLTGWGSPSTCSLTVPGQTIWHIDIIQEASGRFVMAFCDNKGVAGGTVVRQAWLASSTDGLNWTCAPRPFMKPNTWATAGIYRPSIQPARSGAGYDLIVSRHQTPTARLGLVRNVPASEVP